jgi:23S rRNA (cytosine1962-C5)-methyltransferase
MQQIQIKKDRVKPFLQRHAWVFSGAVEGVVTKSVGIAEVIDETGKVLGYGFSDPESQIVCRIFHFGPKPESGFNLAFWNSKFQSALDLRTSLVIDAKTDTYRLIHAEGDFFPGLIIDIYGGNTAFLHTLIDATKQWTKTWLDILLEMGYTQVYHKHSHDKEGKWLTDKPEKEVIGIENGLKFLVDLEKGQKTGFFIDQRDNRQLIKKLSKGRKVLNAFSYTAGFSVYAIAGGASEVLSVDISKDACNMGDRNVKLNFPKYKMHSSIAADCFDFLKEMDDDFDLVILDPPAFAKNKVSVDKASRGYKEINLSAMRKIKKGGLLATFSCSQHIDKDLFQKIVFAAAVDAGRLVRIVQPLAQTSDHPINIFHPEGDYLKGLLLYVE